MNRKNLLPQNTTAQIYNIIRHNGEINRMGITKISGVSKSTISLQINKLLALGMIEESTHKNSNLRKLKLKIRENIGYVAGVFLGITKLKIAIFDLDMKIVCETSYNFKTISDPKTCNDQIILQLHKLCEKNSINKLWGIGIGFPFPVNFKEGKADSPPNVPLWHDYPLKKIYKEEFGCPVLVDNDVNVMALGEGFKGCAINVPNFLFIKIGTGIGSGLVVDGEIYRGSNGCAGDIGHFAVNGSDAQCLCGNKGCLEAEAGGRALSAKAIKLAKGQSQYLSELAKTGKVLTAKDINEGAIHGDLECIQLIKKTGLTIGEVCAKLVNFFNPSSIVIGGGISGFGNLLIGAIREAVIAKSPHLATCELNVCVSELKDNSGPIGAGTLILDHIFSSEQFNNTVELNMK